MGVSREINKKSFDLKKNAEYWRKIIQLFCMLPQGSHKKTYEQELYYTDLFYEFNFIYIIYFF